MNPYILEFEVKEKRREMLEEAKQRRLAKLFNAQYQSKSDKIFLALANFLIRLGEGLKRRYDHSETLASDLCRE